VLQILVTAGIAVGFVGLVLWLMKLGFDWLEARGRVEAASESDQD
jgi:hypothetical protein